MHHPIPNPFVTQSFEKPVAFSLKLRLGVMAVLAANILLDTLFPHGIIPQASAAEVEYQTEIRLVQTVTAHLETDSNWSSFLGNELVNERSQSSVLETSQD